jgi:hypothetical protein
VGIERFGFSIRFGSSPQQLCSSVQLRWSLRPVKARCWNNDDNPAGGAPIDAARFNGRICFALSPAIMMIDRASVQQSASGSALSARLGEADSTRLRAWARRDPEGRLAVVMFGRILSKVTASSLIRRVGRIVLPLGTPPPQLELDVYGSLGTRYE